MDDIRRPYRGERRDYALPAQRPQAAKTPITDLRPAAAAHHSASPTHHQTHQVHHQAEAFSQPAHHPQPYSPAPATHHQPVHHARPQPAAAKTSRLRFNKQIALAAVLAIVAILGGYLLLKPDEAKVFTPASLAKQASFGFYYPSPLPSGYSYVSNLNAFEDGQSYYMVGNGKKHIIVREQAAGGKSLNLTNLSNPIVFQAAGGKAAVGDVAGQPGGLVLAGSTLITLNTSGSVAPAELTAAINNLKLVNH